VILEEFENVSSHNNEKKHKIFRQRTIPVIDTERNDWMQNHPNILQN